MEYEMGGVPFEDEVLDKRRQKSAIKKKAIKFTKIISLVGLRHATDSRNSIIRRFVWLVWVVFGLGFAVYQIQDRIDYYLKYPASTEAKFITDEKELTLPQVTICDDKPQPYKSDTTEAIDNRVKEMKEAESKGDSAKRNDTVRTLKDLLEKLHNETQDWDLLSENKSLTVDDAIVEAKFNQQGDKGSLVEKVITDLGHCFAFSTRNHSLNSTKGGAPHGLYVKLTATQKDGSMGFKIFIHDPLVIPKVKEEGTTLRPGTVTRVTVSLEEVRYQGPPYDSCNKTDTDDYRLVNCLKYCEYDLFSSVKCKCKDIHMPGNMSVCSYANILNCTRLFVREGNGSAAGECLCGPECYTRNYKKSITQTSFPQYGNTLYLYVYYQHIAFMRLTDVKAYPFLQLLCDIGGALSLLLGATLLTVYESVEFLLLFIRDYLYLRLAK